MRDRGGRIGGALLLLGLVVAGCGEVGGAGSSELSDGWQVRADSRGGLVLTGEVTLPEGHRGMYVQVRAAGGDGTGGLWPEGRDGELSSQRNPAPGGVPMAAEGWVLPRCDWVAHAPPELEVISRADGVRRVTDRFTLALAGMTAEETAIHLDAMAEQWCAGQPVEASQGSSLHAADGSWIKLSYRVWNPGPEPVTVSSAEWSDGTARWLPAQVEVSPDGGYTKLRLQGEGGICDSAGREGPLLLGLLTATGEHGTEPVELSVRSERWEKSCVLTDPGARPPGRTRLPGTGAFPSLHEDPCYRT